MVLDTNRKTLKGVFIAPQVIMFLYLKKNHTIEIHATSRNFSSKRDWIPEKNYFVEPCVRAPSIHRVLECGVWTSRYVECVCVYVCVVLGMNFKDNFVFLIVSILFLSHMIYVDNEYISDTILKILVSYPG